MFNLAMVTNAASKLNGNINGFQYIAHSMMICRGPFNRAIQVNNVKPAKALLDPFQSLCSWIIIINGVTRHIALHKTNAATFF